MALCGGMRGFWLARLARPMNAALLLLVVSLALHWGLASSYAATSEATRAKVALERITPPDAENHLALVRSAAHGASFVPADHCLVTASENSGSSDEHQLGPHRSDLPPENTQAAATAFCRLVPIVPPRKAFQARAPPVSA
jgi:hypothetical protein